MGTHISIKGEEASLRTFHDPPSCLSPKNTFGVDLVLFVAAHHSKRHRLLWTQACHMVPHVHKSRLALQRLRTLILSLSLLSSMSSSNSF